MPSLGILFSLSALFSWAIGDFLIQKSARTVGSVKTLFYIGLFGTVALFPFIADEIAAVFSNGSDMILLLTTVVITVFTALFDFEALRQGKFAIIQPIFGLELPLTVALSIVFRNEHLTVFQLMTMFLVFCGIVLTITEGMPSFGKKKDVLEKGVILAGIGVIGMALANFTTGVSSQETSPLFANWFIACGIMILCALYLMIRGEFRNLWDDFQKAPKLITSMTVFDGLAWISFSYAVVYIPISIATAISETYVAIAVLLGLFLNKETVKKHQLFGVILAICGIILLSLITAE